MEQFRQIGEVLGSLRALMVLQDSINVNSRQCRLLVDAFDLAFDAIADALRTHLTFDPKHTLRWRPLEHPLAELHLICLEGEHYVRRCLEPKPIWWGKALALSREADCVEFHLHNLLWCVPVVLEAIEAIAEGAAGFDDEATRKNRVLVSKKYEKEWMEPRLFQHKLGELYLTSKDFCTRLDSASREDHWILSQILSNRKISPLDPLTDHEKNLCELLISPKSQLFPSSVLVQSPGYQVCKSSSNFMEVQWMGESFLVEHLIRRTIDEASIATEISALSSIVHPNVSHYMYVLADQEKKEWFLVMECMSMDLSNYTKNLCSAKNKASFPLLVAVDTMLQIARGMEYLHSKKLFHGDLNPSNILVKARSCSPDGYLHVKVAGFAKWSTKNSKSSTSEEGETDPCIWYAPEVLQEQEQAQDGSTNTSNSCINGSLRCTEKADIYSFGMICFQLLTGKVPFEDEHRQKDNTSKNIRVGVRPLFPSQSPKYLTNLTKKCWHSDPMQRPSFSTICRLLRYIKRFLVMNSEHIQPLVDYFELESSMCKCFPSWVQKDVLRASEVPFQMFAYRVLEREKTSANVKDMSWDMEGDETSVWGGEKQGTGILTDDLLSLPQVNPDTNMKSSAKKIHGKLKQQLFRLVSPGQKKNTTTVIKSPQLSGRSFSVNNNGNRLQQVLMSPARRRRSGHVSDSELT